MFFAVILTGFCACSVCVFSLIMVAEWTSDGLDPYHLDYFNELLYQLKSQENLYEYQ